MYIKQHISKLVIADDHEAMFEGQSSQPEKFMSFNDSGDTFIQIRVEVKRLIFCLKIWFSPSYECNTNQ